MRRNSGHRAGMEMGKHPAGGKKVWVFLAGHFRRILIFDDVEFTLTPGKMILVQIGRSRVVNVRAGPSPSKPRRSYVMPA